MLYKYIRSSATVKQCDVCALLTNMLYLTENSTVNEWMQRGTTEVFMIFTHVYTGNFPSSKNAWCRNGEEFKNTVFT